jgi:hypothetical protein
MDPVILTVLFKGIGMLLAIGGGILIARYGFHLYRDGAGSGRDRAVFEVGPVKIKAYSVGSIVMASAFLWAWAGVVLSPNLDKKGGEIRVYSFTTPEMSLSSLAVEVSTPKTAQAIQNNPEELKKLFETALVNTETSKAHKYLELNGKRATYELKSISALRAETGQYLVTTDIKAGEKTATLTFEPKVEEGRVVFIPTGVGKSNMNDR